MAMPLPIRFPSEADDLRLHIEADRRLTVGQRLHLVDDMIHAAELLSAAGGMRDAGLKRQEQQETEWQERMSEFIKKHVPSK